MEIENLIRLATAEFLNNMIARYYQTRQPVIAAASAKVAKMPYLDNGVSRNGSLIEIEVTQTESAEITLPARLVLKAGKNTAGQAAQEIFFYECARDADLPVARCYGTGWLEEEEIALLLMELVPAEHFYFGPEPDHLAQYQQAVRSLAQLHAWQWNHPSLGTGQFQYRWSAEFIEGIMILAHTGLDKFRGADHQLDPATLSLIESVLEQLPSLLFARVEEGGPMCINHGDAGLWNFMFQNDPEAPAIMLDFPQSCVNPPAWDLVYMTSLNWPTGFRRAHEGSLMVTYHDTLSQLGITYNSQSFARDRKLCALGMTGVAMVYLATGARSVQESAVEIQRLLAVFDDYNAMELLG